MRIACPSCNAVYQVPDEQLGEGRVVRCVRCGTDWSPLVAGLAEGQAGREAAPESAPDDPPETLHDALPEPLPESSPESAPQSVLPEEAEPPSRRMALDEDGPATIAHAVATPAAPVVATPALARRGSLWLTMAWVASVLAVMAGLAGLVVRREALMQAWPPSIRAYAALGLANRP